MVILVLLYHKLGQLREQQIHVNATDPLLSNTLSSNQDGASDKEDATEMSELLSPEKNSLEDSGNWWCLLSSHFCLCVLLCALVRLYNYGVNCVRTCVWPVINYRSIAALHTFESARLLVPTTEIIYRYSRGGWKLVISGIALPDTRSICVFPWKSPWKIFSAP